MKPEDRFVEQLRRLIAPNDSAVLVGPGDDAAVVLREAGPLAATTDLLVEGVDFFPGEDPERLGRRVAAVNLSDLAALGAQPEFFLLSIAFPPERGEEFALAVARGAIERSAPFGAALVGGDLSASARVVVSVALWGRPAGAPIVRSGAHPGDVLYLSGHPGRAAAGLRLARRLAAFGERGSKPTPRFPEISAEHQRELLDAYHDPIPRVALGLALAREGLATAAIDVSDGLGVDAGRLARASGARLVIERERLPVAPALVAFGAMEDLDPTELVLAGGDDYELLFTVSADRSDELAARAGGWGVPVTRIGSVRAGSGAALTGPGGEREIADLGHDHLESRPSEAE